MLKLPVRLIAAVARNRVIGVGNTLPWRMPADLKRFKELTTGSTIVMGRNTYESIGRPLPKRRNIVVSTKMQPVDGVEVVPSLFDALKLCGFDCNIIGGASLYEEAMDIAGTMILTHVEQNFAGDVYFPVVDENKWKQTELEQGEDGGLNYRVVSYERIRW